MRTIVLLTLASGLLLGLVHSSTSFAQGGWYIQDSVTTNHALGAVHFPDANTGIAVGEDVILRTTDGGVYWTVVYQASTQGDREWLNGVHFTDANTGIAVGQGVSGRIPYGVALRTTDGGETWENHYGGSDIEFYDVCFADANTGLAVGGEGAVSRTTDGGVTWDASYWAWMGHYAWRGICFSAAHTVTVVGGDGRIIHSKDGGLTWVTQWGALGDLFSVHFTDSVTGTAVGSGGLINRTTDGGNTWVQQTSGTTRILHSVFFTDANTGTVVGEEGTILRTTNGGVTWVSQPSGTSRSLNGVFFTDSYTGTVVGGGGTILRTTTGGVTGVEEEPTIEGELPKSYALRQNYPNPFNPSTTIEFALPHSGYIYLKVHNVLGEEVATLIDGDHDAGTFKATWDASGLPSGVYFYRLTAGDFTQTRQMLLLK
jgi:photosystem II stability/assembly factor-like uncharacterized protein